MSSAGINWTDIQVLSTEGVNWTDIQLLSDAGINWTDLQSMTESSVNWDDLAAMTGSGISFTSLSGMTTSNINWSGIGSLSASGIDWTSIASVGGEVSSILSLATDVESSVASILGVVEDLEERLGGEGSTETLFGKVGGLEEILEQVQDLAANIADETEESNEKARQLINTLVDMANQSSKAFGFIGEEITKLSEQERSDMKKVQSKLEEIKTYVVAVKEATDARDQLENEQTVEKAVVKAWLELGDE